VISKYYRVVGPNTIHGCEHAQSVQGLYDCSGYTYVPESGYQASPGCCQDTLAGTNRHSPAMLPAGPAGVAPTAVVDARRAAAAASAVFSTWSKPPLSCITRSDVSSAVLDSRADAMRVARMRLVRSAFLQGGGAAAMQWQQPATSVACGRRKLDVLQALSGQTSSWLYTAVERRL
jgi:hypothetical protein